MLTCRTLTLLTLTALVAEEAQAAQTGNARGQILDEGDIAVPGALVTVSGPLVGGARQTTTDDNGGFRFVALPPGTHDVIVEKAGFSKTRLKVTVRLDETVVVNVVLKLSQGTEELLIEETLPVIDTSRTAVSTEITAEALQNLPVGRSYQSAVNMVPGVYGRVDTSDGGPGDGNPSVRGEGQYGNNFLVDGISTRDPATKTFGADVNFDAIQSIQVYTDGAPAEFGQATGMLVNVVTKDGGDEHFGSAGYYLNTTAARGTYLILDLEKNKEVPTEKRKAFVQELAGTAGGPIVKEKLWYFGAFSGTLDKTEYEGTGADAPYKDLALTGFAKLTWFATPDFTIQGQLAIQRQNVENYETSGLYAPEAQSQRTEGNIAPVFTLRWRPNDRSELELKASYLNIFLDQTPMSEDEDAASFVNVETGEISGNFDSLDLNDRNRVGAAIKYTLLINDFLGDHRFKFGADYWKLKDARELSYTGPGDGIQYQQAPSAGLPCTGPDYADCYGYTEYTDVGEPLGHIGNTMSFFIQDDWSPAEPFTLNLGLRVDRETLYQNAETKVMDAWMPAPRAGLAWDVTNDDKTLISLNYGRYYDLSGNTFAEWADTKSAFVYKEYAYNADTGAYDLVWVQDPQTDPLVYCTEDSLSGWEEHMIKDYGFSPEQAAENMALANKYCGEGLKPYHMDKVVLGVEREIIPMLAIGLKGIASVTRDIPEDIDTNLDTWVIANTDMKYRDYKALELTVERKLHQNWQAMAAYTLSAARGHMPGQFDLASGGQQGSDGNQVGVYLDDINDPDTRAMYYDAGYGWLLDGLYGLGTVNDDAGYYGYLPYHSFHQVKVSGFYHFDFGTTLGAVYEFDSGHAWQRREMVDLYSDYYRFPEGRGTRFMPPVHYIDLHIGHKVEFARKQSIEATLDVFNAPDFETPVTAYENDNESFGLTMFRQSPRSIRAGLAWRY